MSEMLGHVNLPEVPRPRHGEPVHVTTPSYKLPPSEYEAMAKRLWDIYTSQPQPSVQGARMLHNYGSFRAWTQENLDKLHREGLLPNQFFMAKDPLFSAALAAQSL